MVRRASSRASLIAFVSLLCLLVSSQTVLASVSWHTVHSVSPGSSWNDGLSLARTTTSTASYLHAVYATDVVNGQPVSDSGPRAGVYYRRGTSSGSSWGTPKRINGNGTHADHPAIATAGKYVYVAYETIGSWDAYDPSAPRVVELRLNSNHGASGAWQARRQFSSVSGRVDRPSIAAAGAYMYMAYTDADTGDIVVGRSYKLYLPDSGGLARNVGTTTNLQDEPDDGYAGWPVIAGAGSNVVVAWVADASGAIKVRTSTNHGNTWSSVRTLVGSGGASPAVSAAGGRLAVSWVDTAARALRLKVWSSGSWHTTRTVATYSPTRTYKAFGASAIALAGAKTVGVAWVACRQADCSASSTTGVDVRWRESSDNGKTWKHVHGVASYTDGSARRINDDPSVVLAGTSKRYVTYNTTSASGGSSRVRIRVGS
jgi:hypothetical protein